MNDQQPYQSSSSSDWRESHRIRRNSPWIAGAFLIFIGVALMFQNLGLLKVDNWWAFFILLPAAGSFGKAWESYQSAGGRLDGEARRSLIAGFMFTIVSMAFLFSVNWALLWPAVLILGGAGILLSALLPN